eukprot:580572-Pyramimonas_sp.AAC.1
MHYLDVCFANVVILPPNCRTTGLPSYFNSAVNNDTWYEHHKEDLPHIKFSGKVAVRQNDIRWFLFTRTTGGYLGGRNTAMDF